MGGSHNPEAAQRLSAAVASVVGQLGIILTAPRFIGEFWTAANRLSPPHGAHTQTRPQLNQFAKSVVDLATGEVADSHENVASSEVAASASWGLKGGRARAQNLTPERQAKIATRAAAVRWKRNDN